MPTEETTFEIPFLVCVPSHKNKGVEQSLLALILDYCKRKGATKVVLRGVTGNLAANYEDGTVQACLNAGFV